MANQNLFASANARPPQASARNEAGGVAYDRDPRQALAQFAATGCFNGTFHAKTAVLDVNLVIGGDLVSQPAKKPEPPVVRRSGPHWAVE